MATIMKAKDTVSARLAECYVTIDGKRYNFMQAINLEAKIEKTKVEVPILGQTGKGNKASGWVGKGTAKFHYNTSVFRKLLQQYKKSGTDIYFEIQVINNDPTSDAGSQTIILTDCNIDGGIIAKFDADGTYLDEELSFSFEDFSVEESFNTLEGML